MAFHQINGFHIRTDNIFPPIPSREFDWCATDDDRYDGDGSPIGYGETEDAAIADLLEQLEDDASAPAHSQFGVGA